MASNSPLANATGLDGTDSLSEPSGIQVWAEVSLTGTALLDPGDIARGKLGCENGGIGGGVPGVNYEDVLPNACADS